MSDTVLDIKDLKKTYATGAEALKGINLSIKKGEIFGLLGKNGAGKTTMIEIICGLVQKTSGSISVLGHDHEKDYRFARAKLGLVPQEIQIDGFATVSENVRASRGYFGLKPNQALFESILKSLQLWEKRDQASLTLSGGMKRRLLIAKALIHEPEILFLDEPTAGVDIELRKDLWDYVGEINRAGTTIILTTHYIEEAQRMADRIGIIDRGELLLVREKNQLLDELGKKKAIVTLAKPLTALPDALQKIGAILDAEKHTIHFDYSSDKDSVDQFLQIIHTSNLKIHDITTERTSLEDIFVDLTAKKI